MPLNVDSGRALRTPGELRALVEAVRDAPASEPETDSVEWKGSWDLADAGHRFETGKHILGFGNRSVVAAARTFEGCAYLLAGVEPGKLVGTAILDPADIDNYLSKYVLPGQPRWHPSYVTVEGQQVLVITVEAPRDGDPICTLQRAYEGAEPGRIFIRRHGKTLEATPAEVRALEARLRNERPRVELSLTRTNSSPLRAVGAGIGAAERLAARERERLLRPLWPSTGDPVGPVGVLGPRREINPRTLSPLESRAPEEFEEEVEEYVSDPAQLFRAMTAEYAMQTDVAVLRLAVLNATERNFEGVEVELTVPSDVLATLDEEDVRDLLDVPDTPVPWGNAMLTREAARGIRELAQRGTRNKVGHGRVRLGAGQVRPGASVALPDLHLLIPAKLAGEHLSVRWRITSTSADSWREGEIVCEVGAQVEECNLG